MFTPLQLNQLTTAIPRRTCRGVGWNLIKNIPHRAWAYALPVLASLMSTYRPHRYPSGRPLHQFMSRRCTSRLERATDQMTHTHAHTSTRAHTHTHTHLRSRIRHGLITLTCCRRLACVCVCVYVRVRVRACVRDPFLAGWPAATAVVRI